MGLFCSQHRCSSPTLSYGRKVTQGTSFPDKKFSRNMLPNNCTTRNGSVVKDDHVLPFNQPQIPYRRMTAKTPADTSSMMECA